MQKTSRNYNNFVATEKSNILQRMYSNFGYNSVRPKIAKICLQFSPHYSLGLCDRIYSQFISSVSSNQIPKGYISYFSISRNSRTFRQCMETPGHLLLLPMTKRRAGGIARVADTKDHCPSCNLFIFACHLCVICLCAIQ